MQPAFAAENLEVRHGDTLALSDLTIDVPKASSLAVIGPNGSGKSTFLGALAGTVDPFSGSLRVDSSQPAFVLQSTEVDKSLPLTVTDAISLARYPTLGLFKRFKAADRAAVSEAMSRMNIEELSGRQLHELSGGQRQRVLVAQGLAQDAGLLLLDEPVTGLDVASRSLIFDAINDEVAAGRTVVMTTHDLDEARHCNFVLLLDTKPVAFGTPDDVLIEEHLRPTFGGKFVRIGDEIFLDDPHHDHAH